MSNQYFDKKDTLYDITEKYEEAMDLLMAAGFENIKDDSLRKSFGRSISLEEALRLKNISVEIFETQLVEKIENGKAGFRDQSMKKEQVRIAGVLPCPVKIPLTEAFESWLKDRTFDFDVDYELKAAAMGIDWLREELPDVIISAGFDVFFDNSYFGKYKSENVFEDITGFEEYNKDFHNDLIELKDPDRQYSMIGVVPAVFLVNQEELHDRKMPDSWEDILKEEFENSISLPVGDFDLFNAILLNIYKEYGEDGVKKLGKNLQKSMHPSEMVKSHIKRDRKPAVTIMPYFFTNMVKKGSPMAAVWPKEGAIISPLFMLSKKEKKEKLKPIVDFFASKEVGEILSHNGKFPSVNPEVDNRIAKENKFMWLGWEYIQEQDISSLIRTCEELFKSTAKGDE